ncbi:hypothetical protein ACFU2J_35270, partial [Streptomyces sp. NPDC057387]|uniref:hypothetical protein n=1 Tax=Streptomyces sp. NPDC057387 TaxID=3346115 RepID=UPI00363F778A
MTILIMTPILFWLIRCNSSARYHWPGDAVRAGTGWVRATVNSRPTPAGMEVWVIRALFMAASLRPAAEPIQAPAVPGL